MFNRESGEASGIQGTAGVQQEKRCHEAESSPGQRTQIHGHLPQTTHLLFTLSRVHLVMLFYIILYQDNMIPYLKLFNMVLISSQIQ